MGSGHDVAFSQRTSQPHDESQLMLRQDCSPEHVKSQRPGPQVTSRHAALPLQTTSHEAPTVQSRLRHEFCVEQSILQFQLAGHRIGTALFVQFGLVAVDDARHRRLIAGGALLGALERVRAESFLLSVAASIGPVKTQ